MKKTLITAALSAEKPAAQVPVAEPNEIALEQLYVASCELVYRARRLAADFPDPDTRQKASCVLLKCRLELYKVQGLLLPVRPAVEHVADAATEQKPDHSIKK